MKTAHTAPICTPRLTPAPTISSGRAEGPHRRLACSRTRAITVPTDSGRPASWLPTARGRRRLAPRAASSSSSVAMPRHPSGRLSAHRTSAAGLRPVLRQLGRHGEELEEVRVCPDDSHRSSDNDGVAGICPHESIGQPPQPTAAPGIPLPLTRGPPAFPRYALRSRRARRRIAASRCQEAQLLTHPHPHPSYRASPRRVSLSRRAGAARSSSAPRS